MTGQHVALGKAIQPVTLNCPHARRTHMTLKTQARPETSPDAESAAWRAQRITKKTALGTGFHSDDCRRPSMAYTATLGKLTDPQTQTRARPQYPPGGGQQLGELSDSHTKRNSNNRIHGPPGKPRCTETRSPGKRRTRRQTLGKGKGAPSAGSPASVQSPHIKPASSRKPTTQASLHLLYNCIHLST